MAVRLVIALVVALVAAELGLRFLLFSDAASRYPRAVALRSPEKFAARAYDETFWKLVYALRGNERRRANPNHHPELGWIRREVDAATMAHPDEASLGGRRPLLVFGDSYANCVLPSMESCWERLVERSRWADQVCALNYGTGGYGFDQIELSMSRALQRHVDERPIVAITLLVNSDLERSILRCRDWPKPFLRVDASGELVLDEPVVPNGPQFLERHPLRVGSYLWRYYLFGSRAAPQALGDWWIDLDDKAARARELNGALLARAVSELEAAGAEYFFVLFHARHSFQPGYSASWEEPFLLEQLDALGAPYVLSWPILRRAALDRGVEEASFYIRSGRGLNHLTAEGNEVVFEAFDRGLARSFDDVTSLRCLGWETLTAEGEGTAARWRAASEDGTSAALALSIGAEGSIAIEYALAQRATRWSARAEADGPGGASARVRLVVDGAPALEVAVAAGEDARALELDLRGARTLVLEASAPAALSLRLVDPRIEGRLPGSLHPPEPAALASR